MTLRQVIADLSNGETSSVLLVAKALHFVDDLHAIETRIEGARFAAQESDERRANHTTYSLLDGIPVAIKANVDIAGITTTNGSVRVAPPAVTDSWIVARLRALGAIPTLTSTMAEGAVGSVTANPHTGTCINPSDHSCHAGGSSGGSAALVAANVLPFAIGSDTMGSIRIPAAYCGISGWKPARGAISNLGLTPLAPDFDTVGFLAHEFGDLVLLFESITAKAVKSIPGLRFAHFDSILEADSQATESCGRTSLAIGSTGIPIPFDLHRVRLAGLLECEEQGAQALGILPVGPSPGYSPAFVKLMRFVNGVSLEKREQARTLLGTVQQSVLDIFKSFDVVLLPTVPNGAPSLSEDPPHAADLVAWVNICGLSAISVVEPTTRRSIQFIARDDATAFGAVHHWLSKV